MTMLRDTGKNHLRYADLLQGDDRRIRACCLRMACACWSRGERRSGVSNKILPIRKKICIFVRRTTALQSDNTLYISQ